MARRVALVHDWLTGMRGGEKPLEVLAELYPDATLLSLVHVPGSVSPAIERLRLRTSFVQWLPAASHLYRHYLPLFPVAIETLDLDGFDLVVSTSHCAAKAVVRSGRARHLCYCFTPMRYAWDQFDAYFGPARVGRLGSQLLWPILDQLRRWDAGTSGRVDRYVAISQHVANRIRRYYNRPAPVIYPPVDTAFYHPDGSRSGSFFLIVSALVPYKRIDLAIEACHRLSVPLVVVGQGPELGRLRRLSAGLDVEFVGTRTNEEIRDLYRQARAFVLPGEEDFGIAPVEAQACGCPVVALGRGGATETVIEGVTGVLVSEASAEALAEGLSRVGRIEFDARVVRSHATRFSRERFAGEITRCIDDLLDAPPEDARW